MKKNRFIFETATDSYSPSTSVSPVSIIPPMLHTHSFTYHPHYIMFLSQYISFPCQYHSTNAPYTFIPLPPTLYNVSLPVLQFSPVSITPPMPQPHLHLHTVLIRRRNEWSLGTLEHSSTLSDIWHYCMEKYFHIPYLQGLAINLLSNRVWGCGMDSSALWYGPLAGCCEHGNEPSAFHEYGQFHE